MSEETQYQENMDKLYGQHVPILGEPSNLEKSNKPKDALGFSHACDLSLWAFGEARDLLIEYFGGDENLHYLLRVHTKTRAAVETEVTHFYPQILLDTTDQNDIDDWELVGFRFNGGKFWHKTVWVEGA